MSLLRSPVPGLRAALALCAGLVACGCAGRAPAPQQVAPHPAALALEDVTVVSLGGAPAATHRTVLLEGTRIAEVGAAGQVRIPNGAKVVDCAGKFLVPGFADMHMHLPDEAVELERALDLSLANGVTLIRGMQGSAEQLRQRERLRSGRPGPELVLAGPPIAEAMTPVEARALVRAQKAAGYDLIKLLGGIDRAAYAAIAEESRRAGIRFAGHVPPEIGIDLALAAQQSSIEHAMGYATAAAQPGPALDELARKTREAGVWNCPTLAYLSASAAKAGASPRAGEALRAARLTVAALDRAGAGLLVGSDSPGPSLVPGAAYVEELREFARAGLSPTAILRAATQSAAAYLGRSAEGGQVARGRSADLVLLDRDPLTSVDNLSNPAAVFIRGTMVTREELRRRAAQHGLAAPGDLHRAPPGMASRAALPR